MGDNLTVSITVFMAVYNSASFVAEAITSILNQTFTDFELLIVNDGSTDNSLEVINGFVDTRIRVINNLYNKGLFETRNVALKEARGTYLAILDSDDIAVPNRLKLQYDFMQAHYEVALCGGHAIPINKSGSVSGNIMLVPVGSRGMGLNLLFKNTFLNSSVIMRSSVFKEIDGYRDYAPAEDYDLFLRIANNHAVANINHVLFYYRIHDNNISTTQSNILRNSQLRIVRDIHQLLKLPSDKSLIETHYSLMTGQYSQCTFNEYLKLLKTFKIANQQSKRFNSVPFEALILDKWFEILINKKAGMNSFLFMMNKEVFSWRHLSAKHFRRIVKQSLKNIGTISKYTD